MTQAKGLESSASSKQESSNQDNLFSSSSVNLNENEFLKVNDLQNRARAIA